MCRAGREMRAMPPMHRYRQPDVVHYCCGSYAHDLYGGVPRYDHQLSLCFPHRVMVVAPHQRNLLHQYLDAHPDAVVVTDNHHALDVPVGATCVVVHHGSAQEHLERVPDRGDLRPLASGQGAIWRYRSPMNTLVVSCSTFCSDMFEKHNGDLYGRFRRELVLHASEHDDACVWRPRGKALIRVLGNFAGASKGSHAVRAIMADHRFEVVPLRVRRLADEPICDFHARKQAAYLACDVFLQLSYCEGGPYATLDALQMGMPVVATRVGLFHADVPAECFIPVDLRADGKCDGLADALLRAHRSGPDIGAKARSFYTARCGFARWCDSMRELIECAHSLDPTTPSQKKERRSKTPPGKSSTTRACNRDAVASREQRAGRNIVGHRIRGASPRRTPRARSHRGAGARGRDGLQAGRTPLPALARRLD